MTDGPNRALLVIDVQREYVDGNLPIAYPPLQESLPNIKSAVEAAHAAEVPVKILVSDDPTGLTLSVTDAGPAAGPGPEDLSEELLAGPDAGEAADPDVALAVLTGLVDEVAIEPAATGTTVTMRWPLPVGATGLGSTAASQS